MKKRLLFFVCFVFITSIFATVFYFGTNENLPVIENKEEVNLATNYVAKINGTGYTSLSSAVSSAHNGDTIVLEPGTFSQSITISVDNLTITSKNKDINPNTGTRSSESIYTGKMTIANGVKNFKVSGLTLSGNAQIVNTPSTQAGTSSNPKFSVDGFTFENNIVNSGLSSTGWGVIHFRETTGLYSYAHNVVINNNKCQTTSSFNSTYSIFFLNNTYDLYFTNNTFNNCKASECLYVKDSDKGLSGRTNRITGNTFTNITGCGVWFNWISPFPNNTSTVATVKVNGNNFTNVSSECIHLGSTNQADTFNTFEVKYNIFKTCNSCIYVNRGLSGTNLLINDNTFKSVPSTYYVKHNTAGYNINATNNVYYNGSSLITPNSSLFNGSINRTTKYTTTSSLSSLGVYKVADKLSYNLEKEYTKGSNLQISLSLVNQNNASEVVWSSSNPTSISVSTSGYLQFKNDGYSTIKCFYLNDPSKSLSYDVSVTNYVDVFFDVDTNGYLDIGDTLNLNTVVHGLNKSVVYSSSDPQVASVSSSGVVTALKQGTTKISATIQGLSVSSYIYINVNNQSSLSQVLKVLTDSHNSVVKFDTINYKGSSTYPNNVYYSVNKYYPTTNPTITSKMLPNSDGYNYGYNTTMTPKLVAIHDTGNSNTSSNALANANYCGTSSSWHYTVGNDGIYQQVPDNKVAWHAGDGSSKQCGTIDTNVTRNTDGVRAVTTISSDGYFVFNGTKSTIKVNTITNYAKLKSDKGREANTSDLVDGGLITIIGANNHYYINAYYNTTYKKICSYGGASSISIEMAVNNGSDLYLTMQRTAKLAASKLVAYNLTLDRLVCHNDMSGKNCPQTLRDNGIWDYFKEMVEAEYLIKKNYSGYTITYSSDSNIIDSTGRIVNRPLYNTNISYTITVRSGSTTQSVTLTTLVQGTKSK